MNTSRSQSYLLLFLLSIATLFFLIQGNTAHAEVNILDSTGRSVRLSQPAQRIVTLAPAQAENLFAAGAGAKLVGTVDFSDYPPDALTIPRVGSSSHIDLEAIIALFPDLVIASKSWNRPAQIEKIQALGIPVYITQPRHLEDIATEIEAIGMLAGTSKTANRRAASYRQELARLQEKYGERRRVRVFFQAWRRPLISLSGEHYISKVIDLCGGHNIFADRRSPTVIVDTEAVIAANPEVIVVGGMGEPHPEWLDDWRRWNTIDAARKGNLFFIHPGLLQRYTPRLLLGAQQLCENLETARAR